MDVNEENMKLYRICTEAKNVERLTEFAGNMFEGCTVFQAKGYWRGVAEPSLVIEVFTSEDIGTKLAVMEFARNIKVINEQECVLVQELECRGEFV
jgi:hypothetical protein